jgi:hypothetical protein
VFIDGTLRATIDTYAAAEQDRVALYSMSGLSAGAHTIRIEVTGQRSAASGGAAVWLDALDVAP